MEAHGCTHSVDASATTLLPLTTHAPASGTVLHHPEPPPHQTRRSSSPFPRCSNHNNEAVHEGLSLRPVDEQQEPLDTEDDARRIAPTLPNAPLQPEPPETGGGWFGRRGSTTATGGTVVTWPFNADQQRQEPIDDARCCPLSRVPQSNDEGGRTGSGPQPPPPFSGGGNCLVVLPIAVVDGLRSHMLDAVQHIAATLNASHSERGRQAAGGIAKAKEAVMPGACNVATTTATSSDTSTGSPEPSNGSPPTRTDVAMPSTPQWVGPTNSTAERTKGPSTGPPADVVCAQDAALRQALHALQLAVAMLNDGPLQVQGNKAHRSVGTNTESQSLSQHLDAWCAALPPPVDPLLSSSLLLATTVRNVGQRRVEQRPEEDYVKDQLSSCPASDEPLISIVSALPSQADSRRTNVSTRIDDGSSVSYSMFVACGDTTDVLTKGHEEQTGNKTINQYVVLDDIGSGASGKVKLAFCLARKTTVAIKVVRWQAKVEGPALGRRGVVFDDALRREIAIMKKLVHPNVVQLYEVIDDPSAEKLYLVMKYADGGTVAKLRPDGSCDTLPLQRVQSIAVQVCSGLQYLHECGVVHCDIKPDNLLATSGLRTMIADFGVSRLVHSGAHSGSVAGKCSGTPLFMAPELHRGYLNRPVCLPQSPVDSDTAVVGSRDMWALGVTLFCLLWGRLPFATMDEITNPMADVPLPHGVVPCSDATCTSVRLQWLSVLQLLFHRDPQCRPTAKRFRKASKCLKDACPECLASRWGSGPPVHPVPQEGPSASATSSPPPFALAVSSTSMDNPLDPLSGSFSPHFCCQLPSSHCLNSPQPNASTRNANGWRQRLTVSEREVSEAIGVRRSDS